MWSDRVRELKYALWAVSIAAVFTVSHPGARKMLFDVLEGRNPFRYSHAQAGSGTGLVGFEADGGDVLLLELHLCVPLLQCYADTTCVD